MDATLRALGGILLRAIPTFVLVLALYIYLARMFFRPLDKILKARYEATEGARKLASESLAKAAAATEEYETALRAARGGIYHEFEQLRRGLQSERSVAIERARRDAEAQIAAAKAQLDEQTAQLKHGLAAESDALASQIADAILGRRVA